MAVTAQVWATPGLNLKAQLQLPSGIMIRPVLAEPPNFAGVPCLLLEMETKRENLEGSPQEDFRRLGRVLARLSFSLLIPFRVFSARVVQGGLKDGETIDEIVFPGCPPGIALFEHKLGFGQEGIFNPNFLGTDLSADVESAISWFLLGNSSPNSVQQVLCHWIGLEALAPTMTGPWQCADCRGEVPICPHCGVATSGPKTVQSIRRFLEESLGVTRKEYKSLYELRCRISHGSMAMDPAGVEAASQKAFRIQQLLLDAIKKALSWPADQPPRIEPQGVTMLGVPGLICQTTVTGPNFYDRPGIYPGGA